jgi:hypothetical protein
MSVVEKATWNNPNNYDILNAIRGQSSTTYQDRIPDADKANIDDVIHNLLSWTPGMNEFIHSLVNVIGLQIYKNVNTFENPLAKFKRGMLMTGDTIEEIMNGLLEAHRYSADSEYLEKEIFGTERPETQVNFHKINRMDYYKLTINEVSLRKAFTSLGGLDQFITNLMSTPQTSDQWDEFLVTTSLFSEWHKFGGFFNVKIDDIGAAGSTVAQSQYALRRMRELGETLPFLSRRYNPAHLPMAVRPDELELFITPEANAAIDVEALSAAFNIEKANFSSRKTVIPAEYIGIPGFQAMLTTREFFVVADSLLETRSAQNPVGLTTNYFLHHQQVISASRFAPAILFTSTEASTPIVINPTPVTTVSAPTANDMGGTTQTSVIRGTSYQLSSLVTTNPANGLNTAVVYTLVGAQSNLTRLFQNGFFTIGLDEVATSLTVNVASVDNAAITNTATFAVVGSIATLWPNPNIVSDVNNNGLFEATPTQLTMDPVAYTVVIPTVVGVQYNRAGVPVTNGSTQTLAAATTVVFTATARSGYELTAGVNATWTFTRP